MKSNIFRALVVFRGLIGACIIVALPALTNAQEAVISGTVSDTTGGVLPGVVVRAVHAATGNSFESVTDAAGVYRLGVRIGTYQLVAELSGFAAFMRTGLELQVGQQVVLNLQMSPAALQESVTVTGESPLVDFTVSRLGSNLDARQVEELPVNGRNWVDLTLLAAGSRQNFVGETPASSFQLNVDGQQVTQLIATSFGQPRFSKDTIAEFEVITNRFDARQGRSTGIQVNAITKSGTNNRVLGVLPRRQLQLGRLHRQSRAAVREPAVQRDLRRPDRQGPDPLLRELRVRARAVHADP
jgi:hypothetical protein